MRLTQANRTSYSGTTLIELVVAISLMVIVMATVLPLIGNLRHTWDTAQNNMDALQNGRVLIDHLNRHLGQAKRITDVSPASQTLGHIEFEDADGDTFRYDIGVNHHVEYGPLTARQKLAGPVSQLLFTCYDGNDFSTPTTDANAIRLVKIQTTLSNAGVLARDKDFATSVYLQVNGNTGVGAGDFAQGVPFQLNVSKFKEPALAQIDAARYLCAYKGDGDDGYAVVLGVDGGNWTVSQAIPFEYDTVQGKRPALARINATHYLCAYESGDHDGWATILKVDPDTSTVSGQTPLEFDPVFAHDAALAQIDDSHYLCTYTGNGDDGWAVVLTVGPGLLGHWKLDETSGITAADASGNGYDGTLMNMAGSEWTPGEKSGALRFDGHNDYIDTSITDDAMIHTTISAWFNSDDAGSIPDNFLAQRFLTQPRSSRYSRLALGINNNRLAAIWNDGIINVREGTSVLSAGQWYHAALTYDGSTVRLYLNGAGEGSFSESNVVSPSSTVSVKIGRHPDGSRHFDGVLDDVRLYGRALSAAEVAALCQTPRFEGFTEAKTSADTSSLTVSAPGNTAAGDLLVAAVATDGDTALSLAPDGGQGWNQLDLDHYINEVTLGVWWKLAGASEPSQQFNWSGAEQAYAWMMRFTGHDATDPIDLFSTGGANAGSPSSPAVTTTVDDTLILRLGAFDDDDITADLPGLAGHMPITMDNNGGSGEVNFEAFAEKKLGYGGESVTVNTPGGTGTGDLLIAAVVTDGKTQALAPPAGQGWNEIYRDHYDDRVTLGVWWKLARASEPSTHKFTWHNDQEAYAWIMRFTGHHSGAPIHAWAKHDSYSSSPDCDSVSTSVANCMILRIGGFDDDDIKQGISGLEGHNTITMDESSSGSGTCSGGAGYQQQPTPGTSSAPDFNLTRAEQFITLSVAIAPAPGGGGAGSVSGGAGYIKQANTGSSGSSNFALTAAQESQMLTLAIAPGTQSATAFSTITQGAAHEFAPVKGKTPALARIDATHYLCAYEGDGDDGWAVVLTVNPSDWTISHGLPFEFNSEKAKRPALAVIDSTHFLCVYEGDGYHGWATILTVNPATRTLSQATPFEFEAVRGKRPALVRMDSKRFLCVYVGDGDDGWSTVLNVNTGAWTISQGASYEFDPSSCQAPALVPINASHTLCVYEGHGNKGRATVLMPGTDNVRP